MKTALYTPEQEQRIHQALALLPEEDRMDFPVQWRLVCDVFGADDLNPVRARHVDEWARQMWSEAHPWVVARRAWREVFKPLFPLFNALRLTVRALASVIRR